MSDGPRQVQAVFGSDAALQEGIAQLQLAGFDRAAISLPSPVARPADATPEHSAEMPDTKEDAAQLRTLQAGMAGTVAALAGAGLVVATGGVAAVAVAAAAAAGVAGGGLTHAAVHVGDMMKREAHEDRAAHGTLVLAVVVENETRAAAAAAALEQAGAADFL